MGIVKQMWIDECERLIEAFADGRLARDEAVGLLMWKGLSMREAEDQLDEAVR